MVGLDQPPHIRDDLLAAHNDNACLLSLVSVTIIFHPLAADCGGIKMA